MTDASDRASSGGAGPPPRIRVASDAVFQGQREVVIVHGGQEYLLRITRSDKLILTK